MHVCHAELTPLTCLHQHGGVQKKKKEKKKKRTTEALIGPYIQQYVGTSLFCVLVVFGCFLNDLGSALGCQNMGWFL